MVVRGGLLLVGGVPGHLREPVVAAASRFELVPVPGVNLVEGIQQRIILIAPDLLLRQPPGVAVGNDIQGIGPGRRSGQDDQHSAEHRRHHADQAFAGLISVHVNPSPFSLSGKGAFRFAAEPAAALICLSFYHTGARRSMLFPGSVRGRAGPAGRDPVSAVGGVRKRAYCAPTEMMRPRP